MKVSTGASVLIPVPRDEVFAFACKNETYEQHLRPLGPVAGVQKAEHVDADAPRTGGRRIMTLTDGSVLDEVILEYSPPYAHSYRWSEGLNGPFALLVRNGTGTWGFAEVEGGTLVDWGYEFELKSALAYPVALPVMPVFRAWLKQGLESIRDELVRRAAQRSSPNTSAALS